MKTTVEIPDPLYRQAKIRAAEQGTSLKALMLKALEQELSPSKAPVAPFSAEPIYTCNHLGFPILKARGARVTNELMNRIREEEGI